MDRPLSETVQSPPPVKILLVTGSARRGSTNTATLRTVAEPTQPAVATVMYDGIADLPLFNPDDDVEGADIDSRVQRMRQQLAGADGVLICTPEYAGALPAALKNLLEWTIGDGGTYEKPVAWINVSGAAAPTGGADAHTSLRKVLEYSGADIVEAACVRVPLSRHVIGGSGLVEDPAARDNIAWALARLVEHIQTREA